MSQIITREQLKSLISELVKADTLVAAPVATEKGTCFFQYVNESARVVLAAGTSVANSIKEFFFPRHEEICRFVRQANDVVVTDAPVFDKRQVIFGVRPCEASSLPVLDPLFAWDYQDRFYQSRRANTTVVSFACTHTDPHCFCSDMGGSPDNASGSDALLFDLGDGSFEVRTFSDKGKALFEGRTSSSDRTGKACEAPAKTLDLDAIRHWIDEHFNDPMWDEETYRCVGCGACTYSCPTCHCFDIVDEGSFAKGKRVKNWDSCQSALFTLHASGHNPRGTQGQRQRQRISHKFSIYPAKFKVFLCTGCGNCTRVCSTSLGVKPMLDKIADKTKQK